MYLEMKVTDEINNKLLRKFTRQEVEEAFFNMNALSSPRPNGFPSTFDQNHWPQVGNEVSEATLYILNSQDKVDTINDTHFALTPKKNSPLKVSDFQPISLCNVMYKIVSRPSLTG